MKTYFLVLLVAFAAHLVNGQQEAEVSEGKYRLNEQYNLLKSKAQDYKDYKVIKENVLDSFWKVVRDSVAAREAELRNRDQKILQLNAELEQTQATLKQKEESMAAIEHDSTHIKVIGIDFSKSVFITTVAVILLSLLVVVGLLTARLKMVHSSMKERADAFNSLSAEFEEYKRKAMEKQTKLSRELQNERNKLSELRGT